MTVENFIQHFANQLDDTDVSVLTPLTEFKTLDEWSSLTALSIIAMADEEYNAKLKGEDLKNALTLEDLFQIVLSKKE
ncbi:MAG: acyl carrier protein [Rikenellaceae bacterium]|nr:acyl carrier protein [Rikenellaceae bacterium]